MATAVPWKGSKGVFTHNKVREFIESNGDKTSDMIITMDQEEADKAKKHAIIPGVEDEALFNKE